MANLDHLEDASLGAGSCHDTILEIYQSLYNKNEDIVFTPKNDNNSEKNQSADTIL